MDESPSASLAPEPGSFLALCSLMTYSKNPPFVLGGGSERLRAFGAQGVPGQYQVLFLPLGSFSRWPHRGAGKPGPIPHPTPSCSSEHFHNFRLRTKPPTPLHPPIASSWPPEPAVVMGVVSCATG